MKRLRHLKLIAAVSVVLLALTGFSQARSSGGHSGGGGKSRSSGHGGGGCSSEKSSSHSHSGSSDSDYTSGSTSGYTSGYTGSGNSSSSSSTSGNGSGGSSANGSGHVTECAEAEPGTKPGATVRVRNSGDRSGTFAVEVDFLDAAGQVIDSGSARTTVKGGGSRSVKVPMETPSKVHDVVECEVSSVR
ncbi:FxLYD domain-containing protein [Streptomyces sp. PU-14G]|uniref:FxLYD domain-containing protein n=1 Tax=Streptomyces sp. PU-14G TaxID=2800808 RepID=UPI0034DDFF40